jgi:hypothetical protein
MKYIIYLSLFAVAVVGVNGLILAKFIQGKNTSTSVTQNQSVKSQSNQTTETNPTSPSLTAKLTLNPNPLNLSKNSTGSAAIYIDNPTISTALELDLSYNPKEIQILNTNIGDYFIDGVPYINLINNTKGTLNYTVGSSKGSKTSGTLVTITFKSLGMPANGVITVNPGSMATDGNGTQINLYTQNKILYMIN